MVVQLLTAAGVLALLTVVPGPDMAVVTRRALAGGRPAGLRTAAGVVVGLLVWGSLAVLGLTALLTAAPRAYLAVRVVGAVYLTFLGIQSLRGAKDQHDSPGLGPSPHRPFATGLATNLLNPKIAVFFLAFLPQFVDPDRGSVVVQSLILGTLFTTLAVLGDSAYVLAADAVSGRLRRGPGMRRLARVSGGVYIGLGVTAALSGSGHARGGGA